MNATTVPRRKMTLTVLQRVAMLPVAMLALVVLTACTPDLYRGQPLPFYLAELPIEPSLGADGRLGRQRPMIAAEESALSADALIPVPLDRALRVSVTSHPSVRAMLEKVVQSRADHLTASLLPNPSLALGYSLAPIPGAGFNANTRQGGPPQFDLGIGLLVDALLFGKRDAAIRAAQLEVDTVLAEYADAGRRLILRVVDDYYAAVVAQRASDLDRQEVATLERFTVSIERQVSLRDATRIELDRARTALALARARAARSAVERDNALTRFRTALVGVEGGERAVPVDDLGPPPTDVMPTYAAALARAEQNRPDLIARQRDLVAAQAAVEREQANAWPWFRVSPGYTRQFQRRAVGFPDANAWGIGLEASLPLFDRNQGNIALAQSLVRQSELELQAVRGEVAAEVAQALRDHDGARQVAVIVDGEAVAAAERARQGVEEARVLGSRTLLEVLDARAACLEIYREQIRARAEVQRTRERLRAIIGNDEWP
jgi:cobalt-zinc-cadmium efflux system outer membrane protein